MKRITVITMCALSLALTLTGEMPVARHASGAAPAVAAPQPTPPADPQEQEWNPEESGIGDLVGGNREEATKLNRTSIPIVGQRFSPEEFLEYVKTNVAPVIRNGSFHPKFIVLHNTASPRISQRPDGFTTQNMDALARFYGVKKGWKAGPHLFVDQNGIWVFSPLVKRGTHSPCFNETSWGIEQLGDFQTEDYDGGAGARIRDNAIAAMAILSIAGNIRRGPKNDNNPIRFHREDTCTDHHCPGDHCVKDHITAAVADAIGTWRSRWGMRDERNALTVNPRRPRRGRRANRR